MNSEDARKIIMDNYLNPKNRNLAHDGYEMVNTRNISCIDNINLYIKWNKDIIEDIVFDGEACAISISSTSIMIKNLIGKSAIDAKNYIEEFYHMTNDEDFNQEILGDAICYQDISKQGNRSVCANLPLKGIEKAILAKLK